MKCVAVQRIAAWVSTTSVLVTQGGNDIMLDPAGETQGTVFNGFAVPVLPRVSACLGGGGQA